MKGLSEEDLVKVLKRAFSVDKLIQCSEVVLFIHLFTHSFIHSLIHSYSNNELGGGFR